MKLEIELAKYFFNMGLEPADITMVVEKEKDCYYHSDTLILTDNNGDIKLEYVR